MGTSVSPCKVAMPSESVIAAVRAKIFNPSKTAGPARYRPAPRHRHAFEPSLLLCMAIRRISNPRFWA